jgi:crossover junction endodeoxyribonuclease RuvC
MIISIDPGISGCIAVLNEIDGSLIDYLHTPTIKAGKRNRVNAAALAGFLQQYKGASHCYIEKVGAMPGQGVASMFSFGHSAGLVEGVVAALGVPMTLVTPQAWKKHHGLIGKDKDAARTRAIQLLPECRALDTKAKGQALGDAILLGRYGMEAA